MNKRKHIRHFLLIAALAIILVLAGCSSKDSYAGLTYEYTLEAEEQAVRQLAQAALAAAESASAPGSSDNALLSFSAAFPNGKIIVVDDPGSRADITITEQYRVVVSFVTRNSRASVSGDTGELELEHGRNDFSVTIKAQNGTRTRFDFTITVVSAPPKSDSEPEPEEPRSEEPKPEATPELKPTTPTTPILPEPTESQAPVDYADVENNTEGSVVEKVAAETDMGINSGTVKTNDGWIQENNGTTEENNGVVHTNNGEVESNSSRIMKNTETGVVEKNEEQGGWVKDNEGTVKDNDGTVETNNINGTVDINKGIVEVNWGTVEENVGTVDKNLGTVESNYGTVESNYGTVENNTGTVENNYGGAVKGDGDVGQNWYHLEYDSGIVISEGGENVHDGSFLKEGGKVTFKKEGSKLTATREADEGNVKRELDSGIGELTITVDGGDYTDTIKIEAIPPSSSDKGAGDDTSEPSNSTPTDAEG